MSKIFFILLSVFLLNDVKGQVVSCPPNIDFENGNFNNWICKTGVATLVNNQNSITWSPGEGEIVGRHTIIPVSDTSKDLYGNFWKNCPNGSGYSVKLGNENSGAEAEAIFYTYNIPSNVANFKILYHFAIVFQDPPTITNHIIGEKPRFQARVINVTDNIVISCVSFDFYSSYGLPGFQISPKSTTSDTIIYKDWTPETLDLAEYAGKTIRLEFISSDCTRGGHFGYAYVDVGSNCNNVFEGTTKCSGNNSLTMTAPYGFQNYTWYSDLNFTTTLGTGQIVTVTPAPADGTVIPLIVTPYPTFGCVDTLYATTTSAPSPASYAGPDRFFCKPSSVLLGAAPTAGYLYQWSPPALVSNTTLSNPTTATLDTTTNFIVKTTDVNSGCFAYDTALINITIINKNILVSGKLDYCIGETLNTTLQATSVYNTIQWYNGSSLIAGAVNAVYSPLANGAYQAAITYNGCTDTTNIIPFAIHPKPVAGFIVNRDTQCITANSFVFTNNSSISDASALSFLWQFGNGAASVSTNPVMNYPLPGNYPVKLKVNSQNNCTDSISKRVIVIPNASPDFIFNIKCINTPVQFTNLTKNNGSTVLNYTWDFGNGQLSVLNNPLPVTYDAAGNYIIKLKTTSLGCELHPQTKSGVIAIQNPKPPLRYKDVFTGAGYPALLTARAINGIAFVWQPATNLSNNSIKAPTFTGAADTRYTIQITDNNGCVTTDTLQVFVMKRNGLFIPNAFTPDNDGLNDIFKPLLIGANKLDRFSIYNRYGEIVFSSTKADDGWDGAYKGVPAPSGIYVWTVKYNEIGNKHIVEKGTVMLVR